MRTAQVVFVGDAQSVVRAAKQAAEATEASSDSIAGSNRKVASASEAMAAKTAAAHDRAIKAAERSNAAFAKWGTLAGAGIAAFSVKAAVDLESAGTAISKAAGTSSAAGAKIADAFKSLSGLEYSGAKVATAFATIAGELKNVEGHALNAAQATKVMEGALNLTDATGEDLTKTTEALGKVMLVYGLHANEAGKASDILFNASKGLGVEVSEVASVIERMRGRLGALAPSLGETAGLVRELGEHGITGRQSLQTLTGVFSTLESGTKKVDGTLEKLNVHIFDSHGKFVGLRSVLEQLQPALGKYNQESQLAITRTLFGAGANKQLLDLIHQGPAAYDKATKAVEEHGTAVAAAAKEHKTLGGEAKIAKAALANLSSDIGSVLIPALKKAVEALSDGVNWLKHHATAAKDLAIVIGVVLGAAMVDFAVTKVATFVGGIKTIIGGLVALNAQSYGTAAVVTANNETIVASTWSAAGKVKAALGTAGFIGALYYLSTHWEETMKALSEGMEKTANFIVDRVDELGLHIKHLFKDISGESKALAKEAKEISEGKEFTPQEEAEDLRNSPGTRGFKTTEHQLATQGGILGYYISRGLSPAQAAGIVGNLQQESSLNPKLVSAEGIGIASWHDPGRQKALKEFAKAEHKSWMDLTVQMEFIFKEMGDKGVLGRLRHAKTPREAARIVNKYFEGGTEYGKREAYAEEAFGSHRQTKQHVEELRAQGEAEGGGAPSSPYGPKSFETAAAKSKKAAIDLSSQITAWAERMIGHFPENKGPNRGAELDKLEKEFGMRAQEWCAMFATTAATMGGASKAVKTASVGMIRAWAEHGEHGFHKGLSSKPKVGDLMIFPGDAHTGFVQSVEGSKVRLIEGNANGSGGVTSRVRSTSEGQFASPIYHTLATSKLGLEAQTQGYENAVKKAEAALKYAEHLHLTPGQQAKLIGFGFEAEAARLGGLGVHAISESVAARLGTGEARFAARKLPLSSPEGAAGAAQWAFQQVSSDKYKVKLYHKELDFLKREIHALQKSRDFYIRLARHTANPHAKKEALDRAASYGARIEQAQAAAKQLGGTIEAAETDVIAAEGAEKALPGEVREADLGAYQAANQRIDQEVRAGVITAAQAKTAKEANATKALAGGYGVLSDEGVLQVKGDLKEFSEAVSTATEAVEGHTQALLESTKAMLEQTQVAKGLSEAENATLVKAIADMISGQIGGVAFKGRQLTPGSGSAARY